MKTPPRVALLRGVNVGKAKRIAMADLKLDELRVVYPGTRRYSLGPKIDVVPLQQAVNGRTLPDKHKVYQPIMMKVMATEGAKLAERNVAVNASFQSTDYWAPDAWARGKLDLTILREKSAVTMDWKTGKPKADSDQLMLAAGLTFAVHPAVEKVRTGYVWLAYDKIETDVYTRADIPFIWQEFVPRVKRMEDALANDKWPKKPSGLCSKWCPVPKSLCQYSGKEG